MNKRLVVFGIFWATTAAFAQTGESRFHLLNMKCEEGAHEVVESSPQSPPLEVDDPGTPGCNQWEITVVASADISLNDKKYELPLLDINYGIGDNLQLKYEVPNVSSTSDGATTSGVGNSKAGMKYMFFEDEATETEMAFYPQVEFITPSSGAEEKTLETSGTITTLPFLLSTKIGQTALGNVMLTANVGYNISSKPDVMNFISASAGIGTPLSSKVSIMGELATEQAVSKTEDGVRDQLVKADLGLLFSVFKRAAVFGSFGQSLSSSDEKTHTYFLTGVRI